MRTSIRMRCIALASGSLTLVRMFPPWFWKAINAPYRVTEGLGYHFFFMWIFAINGILYVAYLLISGEWRVLVPERRVDTGMRFR